MTPTPMMTAVADKSRGHHSTDNVFTDSWNEAVFDSPHGGKSHDGCGLG